MKKKPPPSRCEFWRAPLSYGNGGHIPCAVCDTCQWQAASDARLALAVKNLPIFFP